MFKGTLALVLASLLFVHMFSVLVPKAGAFSYPYITNVGISYEESEIPLAAPIVQTPGGHMRLWYHLFNPNSYDVDVMMGASIQIGSNVYSDPGRDETVTLQPGDSISTPNRFFYVPAGVSTGSYTVIYAIWATDWSVKYDGRSELGWVNMASSVSVQLSGSPSNIGTVTWDNTVYNLPSTVPTTTRIHWSGADNIHCTPPSGYSFDHWETTGSIRASDASSQSVTVDVDGSGSLKAVFKSLPARTLLIETSPRGGGSTNPPAGEYSYNQDQSVTVTETPSIDYSFDHWELDGRNVGDSSSHCVYMASSHELKAVFKSGGKDIVATVDVPSVHLKDSPINSVGLGSKTVSSSVTYSVVGEQITIVDPYSVPLSGTVHIPYGGDLYGSKTFDFVDITLDASWNMRKLTAPEPVEVPDLNTGIIYGWVGDVGDWVLSYTLSLSYSFDSLSFENDGVNAVNIDLTKTVQLRIQQSLTENFNKLLQDAQAIIDGNGAVTTLIQTTSQDLITSTQIMIPFFYQAALTTVLQYIVEGLLLGVGIGATILFACSAFSPMPELEVTDPLSRRISSDLNGIPGSVLTYSSEGDVAILITNATTGPYKLAVNGTGWAECFLLLTFANGSYTYQSAFSADTTKGVVKNYVEDVRVSQEPSANAFELNYAYTSKYVFGAGETIVFGLNNSGTETLMLPGTAPWSILDEYGNVVQSGTGQGVPVTIEPGETMEWSWKQPQGQWLPVGEYFIRFLVSDRTFTAAFWVQVSCEPIYITPDGDVGPSDAPILRTGDIYTLTDDVARTVDGIIVERDNIVLDGAGHTVYLYQYSEPGSIDPSGNGDGIVLIDRTNVTVENFTIVGSYYGIWLTTSSDCSITGNNITYTNDELSDRPTYTHEGIKISDCTFIDVSQNTIAATDVGIYFWGSNSSSVRLNTVSIIDGSGMALEYSNENNISQNTIASGKYGIYLDWSDGNSLSRNIVEASFWGISIWQSDYNRIIGNNVSGNGGSGIELESAYETVVKENNIVGNQIGISFGVVDQSYSLSYNNIIYHNNLIDNALSVELYSPSKGNSWDLGFPLSGNYWSDYSGTDLNHDGTGDVPCIIGENNIDHYPLIHPWPETGWLLTETSIKLGPQEYPVTILSNITISQVSAEPPVLNFLVSGTSGNEAYVLILFPRVNITALRVFIDGEELVSPPFPVIMGNDTHCFVYFELTMSSHEISVPFRTTFVVSVVPLGTFIATALMICTLGIFLGTRKRERKNSEESKELIEQ